MMRRLIWIAALAVVCCGSTVWAQDMGDMGTSDMGDMGLTDMGPADMGPADMSAVDMNVTDVGSVDQGVDMTPEDMGADVDMAPELITFSGRVILQGTDDAGAVRVSLTSGSDVRETLTSTDGFFTLGGVLTGTYQLEVTFPGFTAIDEEITLSADTSRTFRLFIDSVVPVVIEVSFDGDAPDTVTLVASSARETIEETLNVTEAGVAGWAFELGVDTWTLHLEAEGFQSATYDIVLAEGEPEQFVNMRLYRQATADVTTESSCSCRVAQDSSTPTPWLALLVGGLVFGAIRRRRS